MKRLSIRFRRPRAENPEALLARAQAGDAEARNQLIQDYTPFVLKVASQKTGRFLRPGVDEEISVALWAFNQAISSYEGGRGSFIAFSQTVIQRRLVDYFRRDRGRQYEVSLSQLEEETDDRLSNPLDRMAQATWGMVEEQEQRRLEIDEYQSLLQRFGIGWADLVAAAPRHRDSRERAILIARRVAHHPPFRDLLLEKGELSVKALVEEFQVSRKLIERNRKYIIAVAVIFLHDLPYLQGYVLARD